MKSLRTLFLWSLFATSAILSVAGHDGDDDEEEVWFPEDRCGCPALSCHNSLWTKYTLQTTDPAKKDCVCVSCPPPNCQVNADCKDPKLICDFTYRWDDNGYCLVDTNVQCAMLEEFECPKGQYFDVMMVDTDEEGCGGCPKGVCVEFGKTVEDLKKEQMGNMPGMSKDLPHDGVIPQIKPDMPMDNEGGVPLGVLASVGMISATVGVLGLVFYLGRSAAGRSVSYRQVPQDPDMVGIVKY